MVPKYFPILKWKAGEQVALEGLDDNIKNNICPIIETRNFEDSTDKLYRSIDFSWHNRPLFLDFATPEGLITAERKKIYDDIEKNLKQRFNPNIRFCFWSNFLATVLSRPFVESAARIGFEICVRVRLTRQDYAAQIKEASEQLASLPLDKSKIWILLDFFSASYNDPMMIAGISAEISKWLPFYTGRVAVASGSFPKTKMLSVGKNIVIREDLLSWMDLSDYCNQQLIYSDYTCHDPSWEDKSKDASKKQKGGPSPPVIRYTSSTIWHIRKLSAPDESFAQSNLLMQDRELILSDCVCCGCHKMKQRANGALHKAGNYKSHLEEGIIHHIETVINHNLRF